MSGMRVEECQEAVWDGLEDMRGALRAFLVRQCPDENDIEDVIQETFLRAAHYRRAHRVQSLRPWAMRIALNVLADSKRRCVRTQAHPEVGEPFDPPAPPGPTLADSAYRVGCQWFDGEVTRELLLRTLSALREGDRRLLDSYYGGDLTAQAAARECGIPRRLVKVRLYRARERLQQALEQAAGHASWKRQAS